MEAPLSYRRAAMRFRLLSAVGWASLLIFLPACGGSEAGIGAGSLPITRSGLEPVVNDYNTGLTTPNLTVVRDALAWSALWQQAFASRTPAPALPEVDFSREMVVVAVLGRRNTGGYSIQIEHVLQTANGLSVSVRKESPGTGCGVTQAGTAPVDMVRISRADFNVTFQEREERANCQ